MELLRGLSCDLLYMGTKHTEQMSVYTFCPKATLVHREHNKALFFVLERRAYLDVWPLLYLWPPSISYCVRLKKNNLDLFAPQHFWTLTIKNKQI